MPQGPEVGLSLQVKCGSKANLQPQEELEHVPPALLPGVHPQGGSAASPSALSSGAAGIRQKQKAANCAWRDSNRSFTGSPYDPKEATSSHQHSPRGLKGAPGARASQVLSGSQAQDHEGLPPAPTGDRVQLPGTEVLSFCLRLRP